MMGIGRIIRRVVKGNFIMLMVIFLKVNGKMIKPMVSEFISIVMERFIKATGSKTFRTVKVRRLGLIIRVLLGCISKELNKARGNTNGQMVAIMMESGKTI
jgi:hypothetical protein